LNLDTRLDAILSKNFQHPRSLEEIMKCTRFSKSEIRLLYRSFKQVERQFVRFENYSNLFRNVQVDMLVKNDYVKFIYNFFHKEVRERRQMMFYDSFSCLGPIKYAHHLFSIIDRNHKGTFTFDVSRIFLFDVMKSVVFQDYILTLSVLCRGTIDEKLRWIFRLYDINGEGQLTREVIEEFRMNVIDELLFSSRMSVKLFFRFMIYLVHRSNLVLMNVKYNNMLMKFLKYV
jgi:Ca2+-binding EF-hand superfamily protein